MSVTIKRIEQELDRHRPRRKHLRRLMNRAAVAMILREGEGGVEILMIKRAERNDDPWSGHMAFPGGRMEQRDRHGYDVAVRETEEEIGLRLGEAGPCIGRLSEVTTHFRWGRRAMVISPYIFRLEQEPGFTLNHEVAEVIWVPLAFLMDHGNRGKMSFNRYGTRLVLPCYVYRGRRIWGLSLMMLGQLIELLR